ncbi:MAG: class I SAM-dependent methyltransferase [Nitrospirota bacterium]|nr:MAG: class I SAM-dependent methyltransferase [Nitrospirota bacterium]
MGAMVTIPEPADIETSSEEYAKRFAGDVGKWFLQIQEEATLKLLSPYRNATILDVGGGHGQLTKPLLDSGFKVTIFGSTSACATRILHLRDGKSCQFTTGNLLTLPFIDRAFDVVISYRLLPHVTNWEQLLSEMCRVAKTSVIVDYPETHSINYLIPWLFNLKKQIEKNTRQFRCFKNYELLEKFESHGFALSERIPEFFLPMVLHRTMKAATLSNVLERAFCRMGLTARWGSPVILKLVRKGF